MEIKLTSVFVKDQDKALKFYTKVLGFVKKTDISAGKCRWLTVVSPEDQDGAQLVVEPNDDPGAEFLSRNRHLANITTGKLFRSTHPNKLTNRSQN